MLDVDDAMSLARQRAAAMDACAADGVDAGLLGVSDADPADVEAACAQWVAGRGDPHRRAALRARRRVVRAGGRGRATRRARGAKITRLGVRVASHTRAMRAAVPALARALAACAGARRASRGWRASQAAVVRDSAEVRRVLADQVATTVRWDACMDTVAERRPDAVLEVGPGTTLARLWRERHPAVPVRSCDEFASAEQVLEWVTSATHR